ncbi:SDR family oxidoreductase [Paracandidimonas soli]|uniref:3-oxoacyl-[acyl-carrier protein] reductase n=1 Tax=Paracandidimonas soli TaxID=1917182 RepID=A0A4R3UR38_9BURK|nr:SDR family oxidoreductase [Paracandidimonas soli]TCU93150.1 3-oxoacyl-[acyl-carrier protein] reductase [Paracandidimonas soli]
MDLGISGKQALIFGGSRGMGRACAQQLSQEGVQVVIAARTEATLAQAASEISSLTGSPVRYVVADITTEAGRDAALAACPAPDIILNNADGPTPADFRDLTIEDWHRALDAMMLGPIEMIRRTVDGMIERGFGRIVSIVSRSVKTPQGELCLSNGARSGLVGFTAGLARQTVRHGVTVNNILPGVFATDAQRRHIRGMLEEQEGGATFDQLWEERGRNNPAGRYGRPEEAGALCAFLCSAHAGYITGQNILIDGGAYPGTY